jgi:type IV secretory pathway VirJ component
MRHLRTRKTVSIATIAAALWISGLSPAPAMDESTLSAGRFGTVHLYRQHPQPDHVVLFVSGDGGWNLGVVDMARTLAGMDALVVGIDIIHYLRELGRSKEPCLYPAADFESLSKFVQKSLNYSHYIQPILVGYSSGATLIYALICQAPANTFRAALSLGFCPDLPLARAPCAGSDLAWQADPEKGIYYFSPARHLKAPWIVFQGAIDQVCDTRTSRDFVSKVPGAQIVILPKVGHGFSVPRNWLPQFKAAFERLIEPPSPVASGAGLDDLPLVEVPARSAARRQLAVMLSGDGGWAGIDQQLAADLAARGLSVVGLNSLKYFWSARTPDSAARDLERIVRHYLNAWHKEQAVLIGYSLGADVLPFMAARLPAALRSRIGLIALLAPSRETAFEFHLSDWMGTGDRGKLYPLLPEINRLQDVRTLCIYGELESDTLCRDALPDSVTRISLGGGHHFGGHYQRITGDILHALEKISQEEK